MTWRLAVARMISQLAVPKCDGPILLPLDVLTCCVGTLSMKAQRGQAGLVPHYPWVQLLCRHGIDPPAVTELPVEYSYSAMAVIMADVSHSWCIMCSMVFSWGRGTLLLECCSIDNFIWPDYLRLLYPAGIGLGVISVYVTLFHQDLQSIRTFAMRQSVLSKLSQLLPK